MYINIKRNYKNISLLLLFILFTLVILNNIRYWKVIQEYSGIIQNYHKKDKAFSEQNYLNKLIKLENTIQFSSLNNPKLVDEISGENILLIDILSTQNIRVVIVFDQYVCGNCFNTFLREVHDLEKCLIIYSPSSEERRADTKKIIKSLTKIDKIYFDKGKYVMNHLDYDLHGIPLVLLVDPGSKIILDSYIFDIDIKTDLPEYIKGLKSFIK